mmetsp:Transcript_24678/g.41240  ORF Transcript_24678/g.41240 Transcript_24678/m.41240 type:complete len:271 (+) Transcript_24678:936-1748(+)
MSPVLARMAEMRWRHRSMPALLSCPNLSSSRATIACKSPASTTACGLASRKTSLRAPKKARGRVPRSSTMSRSWWRGGTPSSRFPGSANPRKRSGTRSRSSCMLSSTSGVAALFPPNCSDGRVCFRSSQECSPPTSSNHTRRRLASSGSRSHRSLEAATNACKCSCSEAPSTQRPTAGPFAGLPLSLGRKRARRSSTVDHFSAIDTTACRRHRTSAAAYWSRPSGSGRCPHTAGSRCMYVRPACLLGWGGVPHHARKRDMLPSISPCMCS